MANITWDSVLSMSTTTSPTSTCSKTQGDSWSNYARSSTTISKQTAEVQVFRVSSTSTHWAAGLYDSSQTAPTDIFNCTYIVHPTWSPTHTTYDYTVSGSDIEESHGSWSSSDYFEFEIKTDGSLEFNKNGTDVRTLSGNEMESKNWRLMVSMYTNGTTTVSTENFTEGGGSGGGGSGGGGSSDGTIDDTAGGFNPEILQILQIGRPD